MDFKEKMEYISDKTGMGFNDASRLLTLFDHNLEDAMNFWEKYIEVNCMGTVGLTKLVFEQQEAIKDLKRKIERLEEEVGCPLDIYVKLHKIVYVYTKAGKCKLLKIQDGFIVVKVYDNVTYLPLKEYTETWWLKEDKSE